MGQMGRTAATAAAAQMCRGCLESGSAGWLSVCLSTCLPVCLSVSVV